MRCKELAFIMIALIFQGLTMSPICQYISLGSISPEQSFTYTTKKTWVKQAIPKDVNTSQYLQVNGFQRYSEPHGLFETLFSNGEKVRNKLHCYKDVKKSSDAQPEFDIKQQTLQFAYGNPSLAKLCKIPEGKSLIAVRFQVPSSSSKLQIGRYTAIIDVVDERELDNALSAFRQDFLAVAKETKLTTLDVMSALNIVPEFTAVSILSTLKNTNSPALDTIMPIVYEAFIVAYREFETVLVGSIDSGQPGVYQSYHKTTSCEMHQLEARQ